MSSNTGLLFLHFRNYLFTALRRLIKKAFKLTHRTVVCELADEDRLEDGCHGSPQCRGANLRSTLVTSRSEKFRNGQETPNSPASEQHSRNSTFTWRMHTALRSEGTHVTTLPNHSSTFQYHFPSSPRKPISQLHTQRRTN